jgi:hypothetical protein
MTRTFTIFTAVGAALLLVPAALGQSQPQWQKALEVRSQELNRQHGLGDQSPAINAIVLRSEALNQKYGLGAYGTTVRAHDPGPSSTSSKFMLDARERALVVRGGGVGEAQTIVTERPYVGDGGDRFRIDPTSTPVAVGSIDSGREIEWPQVGFGVGLGVLFALGLMFALRTTRRRELAH